MNINYSFQAKNQLLAIKEYIAKDKVKVANDYLPKMKHKIELLAEFPYIGKMNTVMSDKRIREFIVYGYKVIYKINEESIIVLAIYKHIDFNENEIGNLDD